MRNLLKFKYFVLIQIWVGVWLLTSCVLNVNGSSEGPTFTINPIKAGIITTITLTASTSIEKVFSYEGTGITVTFNALGASGKLDVQDVSVNGSIVTITLTQPPTYQAGVNIIITIPDEFFEETLGSNRNKQATLTTTTVS